MQVDLPLYGRKIVTSGVTRPGRHSSLSTRSGTGLSSSTEVIGVVLHPSESGWAPSIHYRRPDLRGLVSGQPTEIAEVRLALLHSVCGYAHRTAFRRAIESIDETSVESHERRAARDLHLAIEAATAHGRRTALELAPARGLRPSLWDLRAVLDAAAAARRAIGMDGLGGPIRPDKRTLSNALGQLLAGLHSVFDAVPSAPPRESLLRLPDVVQKRVVDGWRRPWRFARSFNSTTARLVELLGPEPAFRFDAAAAGIGHGQSTTSRGRLRYEVSIEGGRVSACRTSTPTERLAASAGPLCQQLSLLPKDTDVMALARLVILACDPCAPTIVHTMEAAHA